MIQEKIRDSILNAMQKGANLGATLPPAAQPYATINPPNSRTPAPNISPSNSSAKSASPAINFKP